MSRKEFALFPFRDDRSKRHEPPKLPADDLDTEFKRKYPPDAQLGAELVENARVWKVYRDEAIQHDDGLLAGWNNTINVLLTFAGLFSAAVTAFVVESYKFLQPPTVNLGSALYALAVNDTVALRSLSAVPSHPPSSARWINGLWFTSLFFSLSAAFICILVKQWLDEYIARTRASSQNPKHWSRRRAFYFKAIDSWGVAGIISIMPLLLHFSLFLFFTGMITLLWSLDEPIAGWLSALAALLLVLYVASLLIPVWDAVCPFATPLAKQVRRFLNLLLLWLLLRGVSVTRIAAAFSSLCQRVWNRARDLEAPEPRQQGVHESDKAKALKYALDNSAFDQLIHATSPPTPANSQSRAPNGESDKLDLAQALDYEALCWLILSVSESDASAVGLQALGALDPLSALATRLTNSDIRGLPLQATTGNSGVVERERRDRGLYLLATTTGTKGAVERARVLRSMMAIHAYRQMPHGPLYNSIDPAGLYVSLRLPAGSHPDLLFLQYAIRLSSSSLDKGLDIDNAAYIGIRDRVDELKVSPSLHSTALLLACTTGVSRQNCLLFLCCCNLRAVSPAQWRALMPVIWGADAGSCPRHKVDYTICDVKCLPELLSRLLLTNTMFDVMVLTRLFDAACIHLELPPSNLPTFLRYYTSEYFSTHPHSDQSVKVIGVYLGWTHLWVEAGRVDLAWFRVSQRVTFFLRLRFQRIDCRSEVVVSTIQSQGDSHVYDLSPPSWIRRQFTSPTPLGDTLQAMLCTENTAIPPLWELLNMEAPWEHYAGQLVEPAAALAISLCFRSRSGGDAVMNRFVEAFFAPIRFNILLTALRDMTRTSRNQPQVLITRLHIGIHIMELRPSWWIESMNQLMHNENIGEDLRLLAIEMTEQALRNGPCYECPLLITPLAFDESIRSWSVNPFAVYPMPDSDVYEG